MCKHSEASLDRFVNCFNWSCDLIINWCCQKSTGLTAAAAPSRPTKRVCTGVAVLGKHLGSCSIKNLKGSFLWPVVAYLSSKFKGQQPFNRSVWFEWKEEEYDEVETLKLVECHTKGLQEQKSVCGNLSLKL